MLAYAGHDSRKPPQQHTRSSNSRQLQTRPASNCTRQLLAFHTLSLRFVLCKAIAERKQTLHMWCRTRLQEATAAAQQSQERQASAEEASQQAAQAAAEVADRHKAASKAQAEAEKLQSQAMRLKLAGKAEEAKKAQQQVKK